MIDLETTSADLKKQAALDNSPWYINASFTNVRVEKYRPNSLEDLISHTDIVATITRFIDLNRLPHMLFYGPPGLHMAFLYYCKEPARQARFLHVLVVFTAQSIRA
jgi:hypothetical protein